MYNFEVAVFSSQHIDLFLWVVISHFIFAIIKTVIKKRKWFTYDIEMNFSWKKKYLLLNGKRQMPINFIHLADNVTIEIKNYELNWTFSHFHSFPVSYVLLIRRSWMVVVHERILPNRNEVFSSTIYDLKILLCHTVPIFIRCVIFNFTHSPADFAEMEYFFKKWHRKFW